MISQASMQQAEDEFNSRLQALDRLRALLKKPEPRQVDFRVWLDQLPVPPDKEPKDAS